MLEVHKLGGPILLLAGPGTGKTTSIAFRLKYLVEQVGIKPETITVITFTRAAAAEMRARISNAKRPGCFIPPDLRPRNIRTMHSLGMQIVQDRHAELKLSPQLAVVEDRNQRRILLQDASLRITGGSADAEPTAKCRLLGNCTPDDSTKCLVCREYRSILRSCRAIDYDDQIFLACDALAASDDVRTTYSVQARHLLIDEYQDINAAQFRLIRLLAEGQLEGLFCVGDDDQSIYSFRGGSPRFVRSFKHDFGESATRKPLLHSYRCPRHVLEGAQAVIKQFDPGYIEKGKYTHKTDDAPLITIHSTASQKQEARLVREIVGRSLSREGVLIIVPRWNYAFDIAAELRLARIQFSMPGPEPEGGFIILLALLEWLENRKSSLNFRIILDAAMGNPKYGIPSPRVRRADRIAKRESALGAAAALWSTVLDSQTSSLWDALSQIEDDSFLSEIVSDLGELVTTYESDDTSKFLKSANDLFCIWKKPDALADELRIISDAVRRGADAGTSFVRILTQFQAKGLEAGTVCITGLEEGTVPVIGSSNEDLAESARRLFVSMTRAEDELHMFHSRTRPGLISFQDIHSGNGTHTLLQSRFLDAIPNDCVEKKYHQADS